MKPDGLVNLDRMFVANKTFQPGVMFMNKARAHQSRAILASGFTTNIGLIKDKRSSLFVSKVNDKEKRFDKVGSLL